MRFQSLVILCCTTAALSGLALFAAPEETYGAWLHLVFGTSVVALVVIALVKIRDAGARSMAHSIDDSAEDRGSISGDAEHMSAPVHRDSRDADAPSQQRRSA